MNPSTAITMLLAVALMLIMKCHIAESRSVIAGRYSDIRRHAVEKRATVAEILGDLTAGSSGILNEDSKCNLYS